MRKKVLIAICFGFLLCLQTLASHGASEMTTEQWISIMSKTPTPGMGCFSAYYPSETWDAVACGNSTEVPAETGNSNDFAASSNNYQISSAEGFFPSESSYSSESDSSYGAKSFSLQLNSQQYTTSVGGHSTTGWTQFVMQSNYESNGILSYAEVNVQWWLIEYYYNYSTCPSGYSRGSGTQSNNCWEESSANSFGWESPAALDDYNLTGAATTSKDTVTFCDANKNACYATSGGDNANLGSNWYDTEFNVFGYGDGSQANFNNGVSLTVKTDNYEQGEACDTTGWSGETTNLNLTSGSCTGGSHSQFISFGET